LFSIQDRINFMRERERDRENNKSYFQRVIKI